MTCARFRFTGLVLGAALLELMAIFDVRKTYGIKPGNLGNIVTKGGGGNLALWLIFFNTLILSTIRSIDVPITNSNLGNRGYKFFVTVSDSNFSYRGSFR
jgi:hypothetical protein